MFKWAKNSHTYLINNVWKGVFFMGESKYAQLEPEQLLELNQLEEKFEVTLIAFNTSKVNDFTKNNQDETPIN